MSAENTNDTQYDSNRPPRKSKRITHVSNRVVVPTPGVKAAGGLDVGISVPPADCDMQRIGWSGKATKDKKFDMDRHVYVNYGADGTRYVTFDLPEQLVRSYYDHENNAKRWPVEHARTDIAAMAFDAEEDPRSQMSADQVRRDVRRVTEIFSAVTKKFTHPNETVIVHDYHLIELGTQLRRDGITGPIGFFRHTPSTSNEVMEALPVKEQQDHFYNLYEHLFSYDFVGVQSKRDMKNLMEMVSSTQPPDDVDFYKTIAMKSNDSTPRMTKIGVFPIIGDSADNQEKARRYENDPETDAFLRKMKVPGKNPYLLTYGRLDYTKGLPNLFTGLCHAFNNRHQITDRAERGRLHLAAVAAFGRRETMAYQLENAKVDQAYDMTRSLCQYKTPAGEPPRHILSMSKETQARDVLLGASRRAKGAAITSTIDGMCLNAFEYVDAANPENPGGLILSKTTGAAYVLRDGAFLVNPMIPEEIGQAIIQLANTPQGELVERHQTCRNNMSFNSNARWQAELVKATEQGAAERREYDHATRASKSSPRHRVPKP